MSKLAWGPLDFTGERDGSGTGATDYSFDVMAEGTHMDNPEAIVEIVKSLLLDGSLAVIEGWNNRDVAIRLRISAPRGIAGPALAAGESALMAQILAPAKAPLVYIPPAEDAATCYFDVVTAKLNRDTSDGWDLEESKREYRHYLLTLTCLPFARRGDITTVSALPVPPSTGGVPNAPVNVLLDDLATPSNWAGSANSDYFDSFATGYSKIARASYGNATLNWVALTRTGAVTMGATPYLVVDVKSHITYSAFGWSGEYDDGRPKSPPFGTLFRIYIDGVGYGATSIDVGAGENGSTRLTIAAPPTFNTLTLDYYVGNKGATTGLAIEVLKVQKASIPGDTTTSTTRQQSRTAMIEGSAPTTGAISLFDAAAGNALGGDALIYTGSSDFRPALRRWLKTSATVTADTSRISGGRHTLSVETTFLIPAALIARGSYALMANMSITTAGDVTYTARLADSDGADILGSSITTGGTISLPTTSGYRVLQLGNLFLPPVVSESPTAFVKITLSGNANMTLDEAWIFSLDDGVLTWVREPTVKWIEVRSPELGAAQPAIFGGRGAPGVDGARIDYAAEVFGTHRIKPGTIQIFTVASNSQQTQSEVRYFARFHSHVEDPAA